MDALELIEQLDELVREAKVVPLTAQVRLDPAEVGRILDDLRSAIVDESRWARSSPAGTDEALAEAKREVERLLDAGRELARAETSEGQISRTAERQAEDTLSRARMQAFEIHLDSEQWADGVLAMLEPNLENFRRAVRNGRERLLERSSNESAANRLSKRDPAPAGRVPRSTLGVSPDPTGSAASSTSTTEPPREPQHT